MKRFRNFPIQRKMLVMTLLICGAVLLVAIAALFVFQVLNFRSNFQRDATTLAVIIANQSTAAVSFDEPTTGMEILGSLAAKPTVLSASLVLPAGKVLAYFGIAEDAATLSQFPPAGEYRFTGEHLLLTQPVVLNGERVGTFYLRTDYQHTFLELLGFYALVILGIVIVSVGLAVFLSGRLGRTITQPVLELARTAKIVGERKDYSVRAVVSRRGDELGRLAKSFNEMLSRIEDQDAALNLSQQKMEALIHSIDGIVWERKPDTFQFTFISRQSEDMLGYAPQAWLDQPDFWEKKLHPLDAVKAVQTGHEMAAQGQPYSYEYRMITAEGRTVWIRESGTVLVEKGLPVAMRGIFHNITQTRLDAEQLDKLNRQLMDTSRHAGMADVATGVLHNVGNVLNSVSVSATLVGDRLRRSKVTNLRRATGMLREQNGHLAEFLATDPKGKLLPDYLGTVAEQLATEQTELIAEMESVGQHIEHIKEIVAMQQNYARVAGVYENLAPADLVEDALRLNLAAFERHQITLVRNFEPDMPTVSVDRHKVLQILINLLRNAKHALEDVQEHERCMTIRIGMAAPGRVRISVRDNGVGIPAEHQTKIFNHGFTTKKDGHGFGLHSGANAAKELGGSLAGLSAGPGLGAEFILELPTAAADREPAPRRPGTKRMNRTELQPNHRILLVDDNPSIHADFRKILCPEYAGAAALNEMEAALFDEQPAAVDQLSFELDSAFQGQEALEKVKQSLAQGRPYAMAFVDVRMPPGWDGIETIARIWEVYPELQIVVCTAYADYSWAEMRAKVGQPDSLLVLKKPFDNIEVQQIAHALTKKWLLNHQSALQIAELAMSEERFSKAFHESPLPSGIQDLSSQRFVDVNQRFAEVAGCQREDLIGRTAAELFLWEKPELADQWVDSLRKHQPVRDQEAKIRTPAGMFHEVLVSLSPVVLDGQPHLLLLAQDVATRILLERQLRQAQKMEAIGQLAAGVAHDFNNILTVIQGHAGLMQQTLATGSPQIKSLDQISKATVRAATLIRQLLMFSRKQVMQFRHLDLNETLGNAIKMLERLVGEHVQIVFRPQAELPVIHADPSMLEQIAMNLAVNARDAMPNGGQVTITTTRETLQRAPTPMDPESREGNYICMTFSDTGTGMDTQVLSRIFEPFFTTKPVGKGTGLGLSTVFGIVRQHQGWVEVTSKPGHGTTFRVYFSASQHVAEKAEPVVDSVLRSGLETILVAEDEDALREMVVQVLTIQGYRVLEAASGRLALEVWERADRPVDLLVTDMVMPGGIMGSELAERLTRQSPSLKVIYTSGYSPGMAGRDASLLEGRNFLPKPYSIGKLAQFVRECLDTPVKRN